MKESINASELAILKNEFAQGKSMAIRFGGIMLIVSTIFSFVPSGLIPSRRGNNLDPSRSFYEALGMEYTLLLIIGTVLIVVGIVFSVYKLFPLLKDFRQKEKVIFKAKILKVENFIDRGERLQVLSLTPNKYAIVTPLLKQGILPAHLKKGNVIQLHAAAASKHILKIEEVE